LQVLFLGRLEVRKGVDVFLDAAAVLARDYPQVDFVLVGNDQIPAPGGETYRAQFEKRHAGDPILQQFRFVGECPEAALYQHYADCDIFCSPARYESFGLVFLEAMQFGKPVIGCAAGGMTEIIESGRNGYLATSGDRESLIDCLRALIDNAELRDEFGRQSRAIYEEKFSLERMLASTMHVYEQILPPLSSSGEEESCRDRVSRAA
jgi:glycosyltransferase involved in cell wall biosynthesis